MTGQSATVMVGLMNWNQKTDTLWSLESLRAVKEPSIQIVLVDNASTDDSVKAIAGRFPEVTILTNKVNRGCAGGRNDLLRFFLRSECRYLMFFDNDARVLPDTIKILVEEINRSNDYGVVGVKAYYEDQPNVFWTKGGDRFDPVNGGFHNMGQKEEDRGQYSKMEEVDSVPGGFTFMKREVAEKVPEIDERYFIYFEDSDWCFRVRKAGFKIMTSEKAKVYHRVSGSLGMESPRFYYYRIRNRFLFMKTNAPQHWIVFLLKFYLWGLPSLVLTLLLSKRPKQILGVFLGIADSIAGKWNVCEHRSLFR